MLALGLDSLVTDLRQGLARAWARSLFGARLAVFA
jgi:hypothetical protein